jgi:PAS domain S-box-containing protein
VFLNPRNGCGNNKERITSMQLYPIAERISEAVFVFDADAKVVDANTVSAKLMAFTREELIGRSVEELASRLRMREGQRAASTLELATSRALRGQTVRAEPQTYDDPGLSDSPLDVLVSADPLRESHGEITGATLVLRDVTDVARLQRRIADAERQVAMARIATSVVHDFRNVLHVILQAMAVLEMTASRHPQSDKPYFALIRKSAEHGVQMLQRWREYTRGGTRELVSIEVPSLLEEVLDLVRLLGQQRQISIKTDLRPVALVYGNAVDLRCVFTNLAMNAIEAMPDGGELRVSTAEQDGRVRVLISDTGKGISSEESERIFVPYFTTKAAGTGLGLATAKETLAAHGGDISFTSEVGRGSCFVVELPGLGMSGGK